MNLGTVERTGPLSNRSLSNEWQQRRLTKESSLDATSVLLRCYVSLEEAKSSNRMALAALKAKNKVVEELSLEAVILREELSKERTLRRAAEAADEDQSFLREQMETILKEKARLAQENARLKREAQSMAKELEILGVQVKTPFFHSRRPSFLIPLSSFVRSEK